MVYPKYDSATKCNIVTLSRVEGSLANDLIEKSGVSPSKIFYDSAKKYTYVVIGVEGKKVVFSFNYPANFTNQKNVKVVFIMEDLSSFSKEEFVALYPVLYKNLYTNHYMFKTLKDKKDVDKLEFMFKEYDDKNSKYSKAASKPRTTLFMNKVSINQLNKITSVDKAYIYNSKIGGIEITVQLLEYNDLVFGVLVFCGGVMTLYLADDESIKNANGISNEDVFHRFFYNYENEDLALSLPASIANEALRIHKRNRGL